MNNAKLTHQPPSAEWLSRISYDADTGHFTWVVAASGVRKGKIAGSMTSCGYWQIRLNKICYRAHRLAWFVTYGEWPDDEIDHINGNPLDNRIENLRIVDRAGNSQNRWKAHRDNLSCGLLGVTWNKQHQRWQAKIVANKVRHHLGYFSDPEPAHEAYMKAKQRLHINGGGH